MSLKNKIYGAISTLFLSIISVGFYDVYGEYIRASFTLLEYILLFCIIVFIIGLITAIRLSIIPKTYTLQELLDIEHQLEILRIQREKLKETIEQIKSGQH